MSMPSDAALAALCSAIYNTISGTGFEHFDLGSDDGVCWGLKSLPGFDVVVLRGSVTAQDWIRDAEAFTIATRIGRVHDGFYRGMEHMWADLRAILTQPCIVSGHSLGASRASILTAMMIKNCKPPVARVVFGEPKPGMLDHAKIVETVPGRSYRNGDDLHHDLITDVPFSFPPQEYVHPTPIIPVCARPEDEHFSKYGVFAWHHIPLYQAALAAQLSKENVA